MSAQLCGRTTRRGTCHFPLRGGKCATHDAPNLAARNSNVARAFQANNPEAFIAQRRAAGHLGYVATGERLGWQRANQFAITYRKKHRSEPERWCEGVVRDAGYSAFETEYQVDDDPRTLDFAFVAEQVCLEVNGHQDKCAFGETESRAAKHAQKVAWLESLGWKVLVVHPNEDREAEAQRIRAWLAQFPLRATDARFDEIPF